MKKIIIILCFLFSAKSFLCSEAAKDLAESARSQVLIASAKKDFMDAIQGKNINKINEITSTMPQHELAEVLKDELVLRQFMQVPDIDIEKPLEAVVFSENTPLLRAFIEHPGFNNIPAWVLSAMVTIVQDEVQDLIVNSSRFKDILPVLDKKFKRNGVSDRESVLKVLSKYQPKLREVILSDLKEGRLCSSFIGAIFMQSIKDGDSEIVETIFKHKYILNSHYYLNTWTLIQALEKNNLQIITVVTKYLDLSIDAYSHEIFEIPIKSNNIEVIKTLLSNNSLNDIWKYRLNRIFQSAVLNNSVDLVEYIFQEKNKYIKPDHFKECMTTLPSSCPRDRMFTQNHGHDINIDINKALKIAQDNKYTECANCIMAYTALKPENELTEVGQFENQLIKAYQKMLDGDANDLQNLVLPEADLESQVYSTIRNAVFKIFKADHVRPLLLSLAKHQWQKEASASMLALFKDLPLEENQSKT